MGRCADRLGGSGSPECGRSPIPSQSQTVALVATLPTKPLTDPMCRQRIADLRISRFLPLNYGEKRFSQQIFSRLVMRNSRMPVNGQWCYLLIDFVIEKP